jgi:hypothetical protein
MMRWVLLIVFCKSIRRHLSYKKEHDELAMSLLQTMFNTGVPVGQLRTQLGISKFAQEGPKQAAKALFEYLMEKY